MSQGLASVCQLGVDVPRQPAGRGKGQILQVESVVSPILMTFLLVRVSGVGLLEKSLKDSKPGYRAYMESTSAFVPWFPRRRG